VLEESEIKEFESLVFKYIWNNMAELISRRVLYSHQKFNVEIKDPMKIVIRKNSYELLALIQSERLLVYL
jgi:hypothetical protein